MDEMEMAFDAARDSSKIMITIATGVTAFMVAFSKELGGLEASSCWERVSLFGSWVLLIASVACGVWTHLAITDVLAPENPTPQHKYTIRCPKIKVPFAVQLFLFTLGLVAVVIFGGFKVF